MQKSAIWLVETACIFLIFLIASVQISREYETYESHAGIENIQFFTKLRLMLHNIFYAIYFP